MLVRLYQDRDGRRPFQLWFEALDAEAARRVQAAIERMAEGNLSDLKSVGGGVIERRIHWGGGYRIYFGRHGQDLVILLAGGTKQRQQRDVNEAQARWADYRQRTRD